MEGSEEGTVWECGNTRYILEKVVGNGAFGIVWRAKTDEGETVAIKKVLLDRRYHNRELQMMKVVEHENIIRLRQFFEKMGRKKDETFLHLVMDYFPETLRSVVLHHHKRRKPFHPDHIRAYLWQTFRALEYIHSRSICHRDIKPDNVLIDPSTLKCCLCDFGCSKVLVKGQPNVSYICSRYYRAPELMFGAVEYDVAVDVWSVGTILVELLLGHLPFQGQDSTQQHLVEIMKLLGTPTDCDLSAMKAQCVAEDLPRLKPFPWNRIFAEGTPAEAIDLAQQLLRYDPEQRLSAAQTLAHPFFNRASDIVDGTAPVDVASTPGGSGQPASAQDWEQKINRYYSGIFELEGSLDHSLENIMRRADYTANKTKDSSAIAAEVVEATRRELHANFKGVDEAVLGVHRRLLYEAGRLQLPIPLPNDNLDSSFTPATSEELKLATELEQAKERSKAAHDKVSIEKAELLASINDLQVQLKAVVGIEDPVAVAHGRRPSTIAQHKGLLNDRLGGGAVASPVHPRSGGSRISGLHVQTDDLGQMTPQGMSPLTNGSKQPLSDRCSCPGSALP